LAAYDMVDLDELEGEGPGGAVRKVRRALGARAFGFNYFVLGPNAEGREHHHSDANQEEVYFVVRGSGVMRLDGEEVELRPGRFLRVDPATTRCPVAGEDGNRVPHHRRAAGRSIRASVVGLGFASCTR
jgi:quercetin dioxygenase-like cupin family protein